MKKTLAIVIICLVSVMGVLLCACSGEHTHEYDYNSWANDETYHWHPATCGHDEERMGQAEHKFVGDKCSVCGWEREHVHDKVLKLVPRKDATCTEAGMEEHRECSRCETVFDKDGNEVDESTLIIPATGHDIQRVAEKKATCVEGGNVEYFKCSKCDACFDSETSTTPKEEALFLTNIDANNHDGHVTYQDAVEADCVTVGKVARWECSLCGNSYDSQECTNKVEDLGKDPTKHVGEIHKLDKVEPTCTVAGHEEYYQCDACNQFSTDSKGEDIIEDINLFTIAALGHQYDVIEIADDGMHHYRVCSRCREHEVNAGGEDVLILHTLTTYGICSVCGYECKHDHPLKYHQKMIAFCSNPGNEQYWECETCRKLYSDRFGFNEISAPQQTYVSHSFVIKYDESEHWMECEICGYINEASRSQHVMVGGVCVGDSRRDDPSFAFMQFYDGCGYNNLITKNGLVLGEENDEYFVMSVVENNALLDIEIPARVNGKNVTRIYDSAFKDAQLRSLVIPSTIKTIDNSAFIDANIYYVYFDGTKDDYNGINIGIMHNESVSEDNVYTKKDSTPASDDYGLYYHMVGSERVIYDRNFDPASTQITYNGVKYVKEGDTFAVNGIDAQYVLLLSMNTYIIEEKLGDIAVTTVKSDSFPQLQQWYTVTYNVVIPTSITKIESGAISNYVAYIFYGGDDEAWKSVDKPNGSYSVAYYSSSDSNKPLSEGRYWHYVDDVPVMWQPNDANSGLKFSMYNNVYRVDGINDFSYTKIKIPEKYLGVNVEVIGGEAFQKIHVGVLEYIIIPKTIKTFIATQSYGYGRNNTYSLVDQPATLFYEGDASAWNSITNAEKTTTKAMNDSYNKHVFFFSQNAPTSVGRYWHYASDNKTPIIWDTTSTGTSIPAETVVRNGIKYMLNDEMNGYMVVECVNKNMNLAVVEASIDNIPVTEIASKAFDCSKESMTFGGSGIVIPASIKSIGNGFTISIRVYYRGASFQAFKDISGAATCGLSYTMIYIEQTESTSKSETKLWKFNSEGEPEIIEVEQGSLDTEEGFMYSLNSADNTATLTAYKIGKNNRNTIINIPSEVVEGGKTYRVTAIGDKAFKNCAGLIGIVIPDSVKTIGEEAFDGINSLEWMVIGSGVTSIGTHALYNYGGGYGGNAQVSSAFALDYIVNEEGRVPDGSIRMPKATIFYNGTEEQWNKLTDSDAHAFPDWLEDGSGSMKKAYRAGVLEVFFKESDEEYRWEYDENDLPTARKNND